MDLTILSKAGLTGREIQVYAALLQGESLASEITKKTSLIRTNVYDILASLIKKGIVSSIIRNKKTYFYASEPQKIVDFIEVQEKELEDVKDKVTKILPSLAAVSKKSTAPTFEVFEGKQGLKTILAMSVRESKKTKKEILGISVQQQKCRELAGPYHVRWYKERKQYKIKSRYILSSEEESIPVAYTRFKVFPKNARNPHELFLFGNCTAHFYLVGDSFSAVVIKSKEITNTYREYFEFLWKIL